MSGISLVNQVKASKFWSNALQPVANAFVNAAGYRKLGLRYDDILREETDIIREATNRLPDEEVYERVFRMKTAFQYSLSHTVATKENILKPEDDVRYLTPLIDEVAAEFSERADFNNIKSFTK
ncbi:ubiquinol-cytochrome c reductase complex 14 kDa protein [Gamsiella multidivaricata]|uniref:ubiquinol-cytochrome c reductase complex 14 kDa protein n=1 Tax=Gamsiella multidivaricata TaxID=101098 RepID=UPI00221E82A2|nr:ubiquinol-cytochrome c reductase complex 14 kDa protein [Gamsiella multidivaricata]KAG0370408.1 Cytochrome b-c1 complex subunit 7 [Gamsiella multidivaricata]KAI7827077.1 ubiquinol-cytochrome c reductase complex 14 kDa protein [Gamsiella multidivaricata]